MIFKKKYSKQKQATRSRKLVAQPLIPWIVFFPDGREKLNLAVQEGKDEYKHRTQRMVVRQFYTCGICRLFLAVSEATFDHEDGRGMGGGHRDDRIEKDGKPYNRAVHGHCNVLKGSKRGY